MEPFIIRNARIFDGAYVLPYDAVLVRDGAIAAVDKSAALPTDVETIDAGGQTLLPGLIDAHTHAGMPNYALLQALAFGVTTELDMFMPDTLMRDLKQLQEQSAGTHLADFRSSGVCATAPGGHGTQYGVAIPTLDTPEQARPFVAARIAEGSDYIKIMLEDRRIFGGAIPTLNAATLAALVASAHEFGKLAITHIHSVDWAQEAIEARADGLAHLYHDRSAEDGLIDKIAAQGMFVVPTLSVLESVCGIAGGVELAGDPRLAPYLSSADNAWLRRPIAADGATPKHYAGVVETGVRKLRGAGVPLLAGTDAPNQGVVHGISLHRELELLVRAGLSAVEALAAATSAPAAIFGLVDRGRIAPGMRADLLLVDGDPTREITATRTITQIWKLGVPLDRSAYRAALEQSENNQDSRPS